MFRRDMPAPGCEEGVVFLSAMNSSIAHNDAGQMSVGAMLTGPHVTSANDRGHWLGGPGALTKITREGDPVPDMPDGVTWKTAAAEADVMNGFGDVVECSHIQGPGVTDADDYVLFLGNSEALHLTHREGDPAPEAGSGVYFAGFGNCLLSNRHEVFCFVWYAGEGITESNQSAVYSGPYWATRLSLRGGAAAPTFPRELTLAHVGAMPGLAAMNDVGDVVAPTQVTGPGVTDDNKVVLWLRHHVLGRWVPLLRSGDSIGGRTVFAEDETDFGQQYRNKTGGADGKPQSLNDDGMLAMRIEFTDGSHGLFRISPPIFGDGDEDGDVDSVDWLAMESCCADGTLAPACDVFDLDADGDADLVDLALFQQLFCGPRVDEEGAEWGSGSAGPGGYAW